MMRKHYGKTFLESLPRYRMTNRLDDVKAFMRESLVREQGTGDRE
jgi:hypothetical protein